MSTTPVGRVLVVDDEADLAHLVQGYLVKAGFEVTVRHIGTEALEAVRAQDPQVVVLDLGLPGMDGVEVCRQVRTFSNCYILMLTARDDEVDKLVGLSVGADDYMTKPFSPRELVARVQVMMRRVHQAGSGPVLGRGAGAAEAVPGSHRIGRLAVDPLAREVHLDGQPVALTRIEFDLLAALAAHPQTVLSRRQLVDLVWDTHWTGDEHLVDVHIGRIRKKLHDEAAAPRFIHTVRGIGYRMGTGR
ncbi:DNA-binding response regulator [Kocuria sp. CNJ-770]|uniref:Response regulator n=1 Tax=Kocuria oceani TaxID=988827 RepID=A0ABV9TN85_9MICC|nr:MULTISPECIES: response regulator transcription factor [Kocuria]OLT09915.1 DNA-binding response regulator [Kocuria sp. CNJ-770]